MGINRGKQFEDAVYKAFSKVPNVSIDRLMDPMAGYAGIRNICDFIVYKKPFEVYVECKSLYGNTLNFKSGITKNQWDGLLEKSKIEGVFAGVLVWYIDHDFTAFVPISELQWLKEQGDKSLKYYDIINRGLKYTLFPGKKKRVLFDYDAGEFLKNLYHL